MDTKQNWRPNFYLSSEISSPTVINLYKAIATTTILLVTRHQVQQKLLINSFIRYHFNAIYWNTTGIKIQLNNSKGHFRVN